jgi:flagellar hook-associated protein 3 FlgL
VSVGRITNLMTTNQVLSDINQAQYRLSVTQEQLSSGKKILQPSDDPYGATRAVDLNGELSSLQTYASNITDGSAWTTASDTALQSIQNEVQRVRELVVTASNGTNSASNLQAINAEVTQLTAAIKQDANTKYNGQYLFSGSATGTAPYTTSSDTYQGNTGTVTRAIGPGTTLPINADLSSVLGSGASADDGKLLNVLANISAHLSGGSASDVAALSSTDLQGLDTNLSTLAQAQTSVGATEDRLQLASTRIASLTTSDTAALSDVQDADYATTLTNFSNEQAAFTASLKASANIVQSSLMDFLQ